MEAAARWEYLEETHYLVFDGKVLIIDQTTHAVMTNLDASTEKQSGESRWNGGLAQALEAKHEEEHAKHGMIIRADSDDSTQHLQPVREAALRTVALTTTPSWVRPAPPTARANSSPNKDCPTRSTTSSGTTNQDWTNMTTRCSPPTRPSSTRWPPTSSRCRTLKPGQPPGQPQLILVHDNALVRQLSTGSKAYDHEAVDAKWFMEQKKLGKDPRKVFKGRSSTGPVEPGKVLVVNFQGARGEDLSPTEQAEKLGGLHVRITARSNISHDIDIQAENRAARSGQAGSVQYYLSPQDDLIRLSPNPDVQLAIIRYNTAVDADTTHTTPETTAAVHQAENRLRYLIRQLRTHQAEHAGTLTPTTEQPNAPPTEPTTDPTTDTTTTTTPPQPPHPPPTPPQPTPPPPTPHTTPPDRSQHRKDPTAAAISVAATTSTSADLTALPRREGRRMATSMRSPSIPPRKCCGFQVVRTDGWFAAIHLTVREGARSSGTSESSAELRPSHRSTTAHRQLLPGHV